MLYRTKILDESGVQRALSIAKPVIITNPLKNVLEDKGLTEYQWLDEQVFESEHPNLTLSSACTGYTYKEYLPGQEYDWHSDEICTPDGMRLDVSTTLFLSEPTDYEGGELDLRFGDFCLSIKLPAGYAAIYPTGIIHRVRPVKSGRRSVIHWWNQSNIQHPIIRDAVVGLEKYETGHDLYISQLERYC